MIMKKRFLMTLISVCAATMLMASFAAAANLGCPPPDKQGCTIVSVPAGETWVFDETTRLCKLTIAEGATITAPDGYSLTLTVNGVETGGVLKTTTGVETIISGPATYLGNIVLTVAEANPVEYAQQGPPPPPDGEPPPPPPPLIFPFRQALYLDETGIVDEKSVLAAVVGKKPMDGSLIRNILIRSTGENFNGIYAAGGSYTIRNAKIDFTGNGRSDFVGYGAAVTSRGEDTTLVLDGVRIETEGVVRSGVIADGGSNMIVKNSYIQTNNGVLPDDYVPTIDTTQMRSVPWMLSLSGNVRATNLLGTNTKASYINSYIGSEGWGVLSTDGCITPQLTAINSTIAITGEDGYGSYGIGDATERFLGCNFYVATYATISRGSHLYYGDSDPDTVAKLNTDLGLGLSDKELWFLRPQRTIVNSKRFGVMWHGGGTLDVSGGTIFNTKETTFLDKGQAIQITVDGSKGAKLYPWNGVIMQVMDDDDPGPVPPAMTNTGVYHEPTGPVAVQPGHDLYHAGSSDALATFSNIKLKGDFYNSMRGDIPGPFGPPSPRNLGLTFDNAWITGVISSSTATHGADHLTITYPEIVPDDYKYLGEVTNTPSAAVNNGVLVSLTNGSKWIVKGTCYLTGLSIDNDSMVLPPFGHTVTMTVGGVPTAIVPGNNYTGPILLTVN